MSDNLKEFTLVNECPKCGSNDVIMRYQSPHAPTTLFISHAEHIRVECGDCAFVWGMRTKDSIRGD